LIIKHPSNGGDDESPRPEGSPHFGVNNHVEMSLTIPLIDV